jgi:16S rRNA (guanine966-N2)-methyltransferase
VRVIAGSARGVPLAPVPAGTRPLSDRAREGLFSSVAEWVPGARWADLFAGTGAVGVEALSRGARSCLFVDAGAAAVRTIRRNLALAGVQDRATVVRADVFRALSRESGPFDVLVLDPPYAHPAGRLRREVDRAATLAPGGTVLLTRPRRNPTDVIPVHWTAVKVLTYGDARVLILREAR